MGYECERCGACCRMLIVTARMSDAVREPRLLEEGKLMDGHGEIPIAELAGEDCIGLMSGPECCCPFLSAGGLCGIYPTRPHVCLTFPAGGAQCRESRASEGLPPLRAAEVGESLLSRVADAVREAVEHVAGAAGGPFTREMIAMARKTKKRAEVMPVAVWPPALVRRAAVVMRLALDAAGRGDSEALRMAKRALSARAGSAKKARPAPRRGR